MVDNTIALQVRPVQNDIGTPLAQAAKFRQMQMQEQEFQQQTQQAKFGQAAADVLSAPAGEQPKVWAAKADELLQGGLISPQQHAQWRDNYSPLAAQQMLARAMPAKDWLAQRRADEESKRAQGNADRSFGLQKTQADRQYGLSLRAADRADDPTPDNFVADASAPGGYRPIGPADPNYQAEVARKTAEAKGDVPTVIGAGSSVIVPNKVGADGPVYTNKPPAGSVMDDATADFMAERVLAGDRQALVGLGRGAQGSENIAKIQQLVAQKAKEKGIDATGILTNIAAQSGATSAFRTLGNNEVKFGMAEKAAQESFPIALEASALVPRTQWLAATQLIQKGQTQVNDPNLKKFLIATDTAVKDYARTINPTGVLRESDIEYARKILSTADSPEAYKAAIDQLNTEVGVMHRAIQRQKQELKTGRDPGVGTGRHKPSDGNTTKTGIKWSVE